MMGTSTVPPSEVATAVIPRARPRRRVNQRETTVDAASGPMAPAPGPTSNSSSAETSHNWRLSAMPTSPSPIASAPPTIT